MQRWPQTRQNSCRQQPAPSRLCSPPSRPLTTAPELISGRWRRIGWWPTCRHTSPHTAPPAPSGLRAAAGESGAARRHRPPPRATLLACRGVAPCMEASRQCGAATPTNGLWMLRGSTGSWSSRPHAACSRCLSTHGRQTTRGCVPATAVWRGAVGQAWPPGHWRICSCSSSRGSSSSLMRGSLQQLTTAAALPAAALYPPPPACPALAWPLRWPARGITACLKTCSTLRAASSC